MRIDDDVLVALSSASTDGNKASFPQLDRKLYLRLNKVLEAIGGKWSRRDKAHVFEGDASERIDEAIQTGEVLTNADLQFFPTPPELANRLVQLAEVSEDHSVLEPSAGRGAIVKALFAAGASQVWAVEQHEPFRRELAELVELLPETDFMQVQDTMFDRIIMNPPFSKRRDGWHVLRAWDLLAPGGRLVSVMSAGVKFREDAPYPAIRALAERCGSIEELPDDSFASSGTRVRTAVLVLNKPAEGEAPPPAPRAPWPAPAAAASTTCWRTLDLFPGLGGER